MRPHVITAVLKRNLMSYFSGVLGYLFIGVFVIAAAWCAFNDQFFTNNLANLDQLTLNFPYLLLFIIPAVTMTAWAEEKRQGTDELLFTLPASDFDILLGKYLALVVVYSIALLFSMTQLGVLGYYADPDWGLLITTYFGYWLAGSALISVGMFASALTSSVTVAFVLGSVISAVPVFIGAVASYRGEIANKTVWDSISDWTGIFCQELSLIERLREFTSGVVPMSGLIYFLSVIAFFLYLNTVLIGRRHWRRQDSALQMGGHFCVRVLCLLVLLICGNVVISKASESIGLRFDMTAEHLYTLSPTTKQVLGKLTPDTKITIQAFISPTVPREFVGHQTRLKGLLRQYDRIGGDGVDVRFVDVTASSESAEEARHLGIEPNRVQSDRDGRMQVEDIFMGAVISSPNDQVVLPFFDIGTSIEYELTRSIATVSKKDRLTVGLLRTDAKVGGGFDMSSMSSTPEWRIKQELKKQYNVKEISPDKPIEDKIDVLVAMMPSSLTKMHFDNFVDYVKSGKPTFIMDDPFPRIDPSVAPSQQKRAAGGMGGMFGGGQPPEQRAYGGTAKPLVELLEIEWKNDEIVFDLSSPHPQFADLIPPEYVFVTPLNGNPEAVSTQSDVTAGLQEVLTFYPGRIRPRANGKLKFERLLQTGVNSGIVRWNDLVRPGPRGMEIGSDVERVVGKDAHVIAARITGEKDATKINVIFCADVDIISDMSFQIAQNQLHDLKIDNVKFILNCVDILAGDKTNVELRNRRPQHRALKEVQSQADVFRVAAQGKREAAEKKAKETVEKLTKDLDADFEKIRSDKTLSTQEREQRMSNALQRKQQELTVENINIKRQKQEELEQLKAREQREIRRVESGFRFWAVVLPPIPSLILGLLVLSMRLVAEQAAIEEIRRLR